MDLLDHLQEGGLLDGHLVCDLGVQRAQDFVTGAEAGDAVGPEAEDLTVPRL